MLASETGSRPSMTKVKYKLQGLRETPSLLESVMDPLYCPSPHTQGDPPEASTPKTKRSGFLRRPSTADSSSTSASKSLFSSFGWSRKRQTNEPTECLGLTRPSMEHPRKTSVDDHDVKYVPSLSRTQSQPLELPGLTSTFMERDSFTISRSSSMTSFRPQTAMDCPNNLISASSYRALEHQPKNSPSLSSAISDPEAILHFRDEQVSCGTLRGLVERLVKNCSLRRDCDFRDTLLAMHPDFISSQDFLAALVARFNDIGPSSTNHIEDRVVTQYNIFIILNYWITSSHPHVGPGLLDQMENFLQSVLSPTRAPTMQEKAKELLRLIEEKCLRADFTSSLPELPRQKLMRTSEVSSRELAIAFTLCEGDRYRQLRPIDYISHLGKENPSVPGSTNIDAASDVNNRMIAMVQRAVLNCNKIEERVEAIKFFIDTAQECRRMRNFASMTAITIALNSSHIRRLPLTGRWIPDEKKRLLAEFEKIVDPSSNHRTYRAALAEVIDQEYAGNCIPWLAVHLRELHSLLLQHPQVVIKNDRQLINFERYVRFRNRIQELMDLEPANLEHYRTNGPFFYAETHLHRIQPGAKLDDQFMKRSMDLQEYEKREWRQRTQELKQLGFRLP